MDRRVGTMGRMKEWIRYVMLCVLHHVACCVSMCCTVPAPWDGTYIEFVQCTGQLLAINI